MSKTHKSQKRSPLLSNAAKLPAAALADGGSLEAIRASMNEQEPDALETATPFLGAAAKAADLGGIEDLPSLMSLFTSGDGAAKKIEDGDLFGATGDLGSAGEHVSKLLGKDALGDVLGTVGSVFGIGSNVLGAADSTKSTGERVKSGGEAAAGAMELIAKGMGVDVAALGSMELGAIASQGAGAMLGAAGAVLGSGLLGFKVGEGLATAGDSQRARDLNLGGYDKHGFKRTAGEFWVDQGQSVDVKMDEVGSDANDYLDAKGESWGDALDDSIGFGGGAVESTMDVLGDGVDAVADYGGGLAGGVVATGMGAFAGVADGVAAGADWLLDEDQSPLRLAQEELRRRQAKKDVGRSTELTPEGGDALARAQKGEWIFD